MNAGFQKMGVVLQQPSHSFTYDGQFAVVGKFCVFGVMCYLGNKKPPQF